MTNIKLIFKYAFNDLRRQKVRTILGVLGTAISIGLLAVVLFVSDSVSVSFVDYLAMDAGNQDMSVSVRHYNGEPANRSSYFKYNPIINQVEDATDQIKNYIPRMQIGGHVNISTGFNTQEISNTQEYTTISGINFSLENSINFGYFIEPDSDKELKMDGLDTYHCAIYTGFNDVIKYSEEENITVSMAVTHGETLYNKTKDLVIDQIFDYEMKWPASYKGRNLIVVDVDTLYEIFGREEFQGRSNKLIMTFENSEEIYDARDIEETEEEVKKIASDVQLKLGLEEYNVDLPKLEILGYSEFLTMGITIIFIFVSIITMLIAGILINGILKTSVEERIREFGVFRTLGAHKKFNLAVVLVEGFLLCNFGTILGIVGAFFGTQGLLIPAANNVLLGDIIGEDTIVFSFNFISVIIAYAMGISVGLLVSISPALKVMKLQLIEAIHPYRHEDTLYNLKKKASVNYKLIIIGLILAFNGGFIYYVIPRLLLSMNITLMAGTLIAVLLIFLIGLTLAGLGLIPVVLRLFIYIFKPITKRMIQVIKIFVFRYQRRNSSTVIIFALSFSFVAFTSTVLQTQSSQIAVMTRLRYGSDLVIDTSGWKTYEEYYGDSSNLGGGGFGG
ncbi:MAG: FtsX-like permease family protein, partial [Promethearchaeia archaeon]